jgi:branched-chain amino acid transport system ATP-binding protein
VTTVLELRGLSAGYAGQPVVHGIDLEVRAGEVVSLLGANGAGKTTTLLATAGELSPMAGEVLFDGTATTTSLHRRVRQGLGYVTEERSIFKGLSGRDNLRAGGVSEQDAIALFPELERVMGTRAGLMSGGEQQMLTLARALARRPKVLLADELSLGLAPLVVNRLLKAVRQAADEHGTGVLVVEQHARKALRHADRVYVMRGGRIEMTCTAQEATGRLHEIEAAYLSSSAPDPSGVADPPRPPSPE